MREGLEIALTLGQHGTHRGQRGGLQVDDAQVGQSGLREDNAGDGQHRAGDDGTDGVGEDVLEHQATILGAQGTGRQDVLLTLESVELETDAGGGSYPARHDVGK